MKEEDYADYLQSEQWRMVARKRLEIDNYTCQCCGSHGTQRNRLNIHHLSYHHVGRESDEDFVYTDLVTLCEDCHVGLHRIMNRITSPSGRRGWKDSLTLSRHVASDEPCEDGGIEMKDCKFTIEKHIATLSGGEGEVSKQVNLVSWNGNPATLDIRAWSNEGRPYKGISLNAAEVKALKAALDGLEMTE